MSETSPTIADRVQEAFPNALLRVEEAHGELTLVVARSALRDLMQLLRDDPAMAFNYLVDITAVDYLEMPEVMDATRARFMAVYHLYSHAHNRRVRIKVPLSEGESIPTMCPLWKASNWLEREVYDMFGIEFDEHPNLRRILMPDDYEGHPLRKDYPLRGRGERTRFNFDTDVQEELRTSRAKQTSAPQSIGDDRDIETLNLNFGPQHPATHGTLHVEVDLDGETIVQSRPQLGYLHTGFEKLSEHMHYNQFVTVTDRMNYLSPLSNNFGYVLAVEKLFDLKVSKRCEYIRVILAELSRIADHMVWLGTAALDLGAFTVFLYGFKQRELLYNIFEMTTGARLTTSYARVGGLATEMSDIPEGFVEAVQSFTEGYLPAIDEIETLLTRNRIFVDRTRGVGVISAEDAINYGLTGPCLRASGVEWDLRKVEPYSSYEDFEFDIPIGENGDSYDRYLVRVEETRQSIRIVRQALANLPEGPVNVDNYKVILPQKKDTYGNIEGLIHHFKLIMDQHGLPAPPGEIYSSTEAPNGELGFYIVSDGTGQPYRVRIRPPSFLHYQVLAPLIEGAMVSDIPAVLGSLNVIAGELDR